VQNIGVAFAKTKLQINADPTIHFPRYCVSSRYCLIFRLYLLF